MAAVYEATHRNGHRVAVKYLLERYVDEPSVRMLFSREAYIANEVQHQGVVPIIDDDIDEDGCAFLIMPLLEGETLRARWERMNKRLPLLEVGLFTSDLLEALACAHAKGIVHRDIKPDNLFVIDTGYLRVLDFGIARRSDGAGSVTLTGPVMGTPVFMPPEQALGRREAIAPHSDCWAVGATMFTLLSGEFVHVCDNAGAQLVAAATRQARSLNVAVPDLSPSIVHFVDKALSFDPTDRWSSATEMYIALKDTFERVFGAPFSEIAVQARAALAAGFASRDPQQHIDTCKPVRDGQVGRLNERSSRERTTVTPVANHPGHRTKEELTNDPVPLLLSVLHAQVGDQGRIVQIGEPMKFFPTQDGRVVLFLRARPPDTSLSLWEADLLTGETRELLSPARLWPGPEDISADELARRQRRGILATGFTSFRSTDDGSKVVVTFAGRLYLLLRASGETRELRTADAVVWDAQLSPDGTRVAYVRNHDIYMMALDGGPEIRITQGGTEVCLKGTAESAAGNFRRWRGFWWSPDGQEILYEEADLSPVQQLTIVDPTQPDKPPTRQRYARAGTPNALVGLAIVPVPIGREPGPPRRVRWDVGQYPYLATVKWTENAPLTIFVLDRLQRSGALLTVDPATGTSHTLLAEHDEAWLNVDSSVPRWLPDGRAFLWSTERRGAWELELRGPGGELLSTIASANMGYRSLLAVDAERRVAYISACSDPTRAEVWAVPLKDESPPYVFSRRADGVMHAFFGPGARACAFLEAAGQGERRFSARTVDGTFSMVIPSLAKMPFKPEIQYITVGDEAFHAAIVRPRSFDPRRRYPLLDYAWGQPGYNSVTMDSAFYLRTQWIADSVDAIVVVVDVHGSMWRGRRWERRVRDRLADVLLEGHVAAIESVTRAYPEIDESRVGIYGSSIGGYLSVLAILRRPDLFKVAVAVRPLVDWADHDGTFVERYLGLPPNAAYENASLFTWLARAPSVGAAARPFLLMHGTDDSDTHFTSSLKLANAMSKAGRSLEFVPVVGNTFITSELGTRTHMWTRIATFLRDHS
ncbi:DPP IV N-terminal domain-containing protein [Pendulispora rubella]|uniref:DPP IV N-terminal domain-containing protein n=2 Tax=Pendulispora rubella TaxID=2741070 RepID=A0ABZ2KR23_9BACT